MKQMRYAHALSIALLTNLPVLGQAQIGDPSAPLDSDADVVDSIDLDDDDVVIAVRGIQNTPSSWVVCVPSAGSTTGGVRTQVSDPAELHEFLDNGAYYPESGDCGDSSSDGSSSGGSASDGSSSDSNSSSSGGENLAGGSGLGDNAGVLDIKICDSRGDETGRQISISYAGSVITRRYSGCND